MNNNIIQPLSSVVLHIRSKDAEQLTTNYNTHFSVNLINPINIDKTDEVHISIMSVEIPYSFYNISSELDNNTIVYDGSNTLTSIVKKNNIYGCQFHPEKSGLDGLKIIENFLKL